MKRAYRKKKAFGFLETYEGETIENKVKRIVENKEPISDGAPIIYTEKKDGVLPQFDIRTDKWDIAINAMDKVHSSKIAQNKEYMKQIEEKGEEMDKNKKDVQEN